LAIRGGSFSEGVGSKKSRVNAVATLEKKHPYIGCHRETGVECGGGNGGKGEELVREGRRGQPCETVKKRGKPQECYGVVSATDVQKELDPAKGPVAKEVTSALAICALNKRGGKSQQD